MASIKQVRESLEPIANLDRLVHEPARLMILALLQVVDADFIFVMNQTGLTRGNLSAHMSKLEEADYIEVKKEFVDKRPLTLLRITDKGRAAFNHYRESLTQVFEEIPG